MIREAVQFSPENMIVSNRLISVFLAGGISEVEDWRTEVINELKRLDEESDLKYKGTLKVYNPAKFYKEECINYKEYSLDSIIKWDCQKLAGSDILSFYFANGDAKQASSQFELGRYMTILQNRYGTYNLSDRLIIGIGKDYIGKDKLCSYLKYLLSSNYKNIVTENQTLKGLAYNIYSHYTIALEAIIKEQENEEQTAIP